MMSTLDPQRRYEVDACYYDGRTSGVSAVRLSFWQSGRVTLIGNDRHADYSIDELAISSRIGDTPRLIGLPDGGKCEVTDNDVIDQVLKSNTGIRSGWLHYLENHVLFILVAIAVTLATSVATIQYAIPWLAERAAYALPQSIDRKLGQGTLDILDRTLFSKSTLKQVTQTRLRARFAEITATLPTGESYELLFRTGGNIGANALALPSGIIVMTDELVTVSENDTELVAILAHEIGHLEHRHSIRMAMQSSSVALIIAVISGDVVSSSSLLAALPTVLIHTSYSRDFETEADDYAWQYLTDNGIPTVAFASILTRIAGDSDDLSFSKYLSTHPGTMERLRRFTQE